MLKHQYLLENKNNMKLIHKQNGQIALIAVLIISAAVLIISLVISSIGVNETLISFDDQQGEQSFLIANACADEALMRLQRVKAGEEVAYAGGTLNFGSDSCIITVTPQANDQIIDVVSTVNSKINRKIQVVLQWIPSYSLTSWQETQ